MTLLRSLSTPTLPLQTARSVGRQNQAIVLMVLLSGIIIGGLGGRLVHLQLVDGDRNRQLAETNRIRLIPKPPERGKIFDRKGRILAGSRLSHSVYLQPLTQKKADWHKTRQRLADILNIPVQAIERRLAEEGYRSPYMVRIARGVSPQKVTALEEYRAELEGVEVDAEAMRDYPHGDLGAHVIGYTGEMNDQELQRRQGKDYRLGDVIGQMGIEAAFEQQLRGEWGGQQVEVDGAGTVLNVLGEKETRAGKDVTVTLDLELQKAAEAALGIQKGAIVALDPNTGAILAMVSRPGFDPNLFTTHMSDEKWKQLQSQDQPFLNRVLQSYPPASTFKIVTTTAGLESGKFSPQTVLNTYPSLHVSGVDFGEWNHAGFGPQGFVGAMTWSSDTFFYQIGLGMGEKPLIEWTRRYGFGQKTGIELSAEESPGLVPDALWKQKQVKQAWFVGDTVNMTIGQGYLEASPLQVAGMFAIAANGGYRVKPHLLKENATAQAWRQPLNLRSDTIRLLREGLRGVISTGTGQALNIPTLPPVAGKSGTAEDMGQGSHTWFGAFAPYDKPEIVVVAMGEFSGGSGGSVTAPMVRQVMEAYFKPKQTKAKAQQHR
ncbi:penicillin-binding protein 2 [Myxacorys almedinensis]|uniref:Penicillin-binding protein 2 n=1 Tax=Myxacorys almedinensis A TaxID=2690445 RepID=A0A8J7Z1B5_9CYAN|nr:penicillin-binding protein 2 [Myxacorys almedinensis]NDJ18507.1 penicillin-binding protein 2 [Myxacorys almedinensis A]